MDAETTEADVVAEAITVEAEEGVEVEGVAAGKATKERHDSHDEATFRAQGWFAGCVRCATSGAVV